MSRLERVLARLLPHLPEAWVRQLAGPPIALRGRRLDSHLCLITRRAASQTPFYRLSVRAARRATSAGLALLEGKPRPVARIERRVLGARDSAIPARVYHPHGVAGARPLVLYFHQGGGVLGDLDCCATFCTMLASIARCPVAALDYRLAPEDPFPAAHEDAWAAFAWARERAPELGADPQRIVVAGDSAGGMLAAHVALRALREGGTGPVAQLLIYPWLAFRDPDDEHYADFRNAYPLNPEGLAWFRRHLLASEQDAQDERLSPLHARELRGLAPAVIATAGFDPLGGDGESFAAKLRAAGVPVRFHCYASLTHSFTGMSGAVPAARTALEEIAWDLERLLTRPAEPSDHGFD